MEKKEKKKEQEVKGGVSRKDISEILKGFYKESLEPKFDQIDRHLIRIDARLDQHDSHFGKIEKKLEEHDEKFRDIFTHFDQVYQRFDRLETEYYAISAVLSRIEKRLEHYDRYVEKTESLEKEVGDLKGRVQILQSKIEEIEIRLKGFA